MEAPLAELERFRESRHTRARGSVGERAAVAWLERQGYEVLLTNYRAKPGEIDVVALEDDTLVFLEVKARDGASCGPATAAVPRRKQLRIARVAAYFLAESSWQGPSRFDVLGIDRTGEKWRFELVRDAFWL